MTTTETKTIRTISLDELIKEDEDRKDLIAPDLGDKTKYSPDELRELRKDNKFYLPVLRLNHMDMWPPKPRSERKHFTDQVAKETCLSKCCGVPGVKSACCRMDPNDLEHVLGPLDEDWIGKIIKWFKKNHINVTRQDVVIDFEEGQLIGRNFFNGHQIFEDPKSYPIMRFQVDGPRFACKFLNNQNGMCNIYEQRPDMCRTYLCGYVKSNFFVQTKDNPNKWVMVDVRPDDPSSPEK
ncbi:MAG: YkgJ family cysteine cluster protein [Candidatus Paceibacterota bacterium]|jgi:Fe-S-cluster containining protein